MKTSKYKILTTTILTFALILGACGGNNNDESDENVPNSTVVNPEEESTVDETFKEENPEKKYGFVNFDLHIDTPDNVDAVVAQYTGKKEEALYFNMHTANNSQGEAANALLQPILGELQPMQDMSDEEVIQRVASAFEVDEYTNFDLSIEYEDGETKTYIHENQ